MLSVAKLIEQPLFLAIKRSCPFCQRALSLSDANGIKPTVVDVLESAETGKLRDELEQKTGQKTVPFVFSRGRFIGGYSDLAKEPESFWNALK